MRDSHPSWVSERESGLWAGEFGELGKVLGEPLAEPTDTHVERRKIVAKLRLRLAVSLLGRLADRLHQPGVEALPLLDGVLVGPHGPRKRVIAGREARAHTGDRASRAGGLGELPNIEGFRKQFGAPLGFLFDDGLDDVDVVQKDDAYACLLLVRPRRACRARPSGTNPVDGRRSAKLIHSRLVAALGAVQLGKIVEAQGDIGMIRPERLLPDRQRPLVERFSLIVSALIVVQRGEVIEAVGHIGMIRPESLFPDGQRPLVERFRRLVAALHAVQRGKVVEAQRDIGMFRPESLLLEGQRPIVERLHLLVSALVVVQHGKVIEAVGHIGMVRSESLLLDCKCPLVEQLRRLVAALGAVQRGEVVEAQGDIGMVRPESLLLDCKCPLVERLRRLVAALGAV